MRPTLTDGRREEVTPSIEHAMFDGTVTMVLLVRMDFAGGVVAVNSGVNNILWNGDNYLGVGDLGGISTIEEGINLQMYGVKLSLTGVPSSYISIAMNEDYQGRDIQIWFTLLDKDHDILATQPPVTVFKGRMDYMEVILGDTGTVNLYAESALAAWDKVKPLTYNNATQQDRYPGDQSLITVEQLENKELLWGAKGVGFQYGR